MKLNNFYNLYDDSKNKIELLNVNFVDFISLNVYAFILMIKNFWCYSSVLNSFIESKIADFLVQKFLIGSELLH